MRRAATLYADASLCFSKARTHGCLPSQVREAEFPEDFYIEFCVRHNGTLPSAPLTKPLHVIAYPSI